MPITGKRSDSKSRKVTPPSPSYMSNDQFELRSNRVARPGGARPQPAGARPAPSRTGTHRSTTNGRFSPDAVSQADSLNSNVPSVAAGSVASRYSTTSGRTRSYFPTSASTPLKPGEVVPSAIYMERGQRWMEREEVSSLRDAMDEMDLRSSTKGTPAPQDNPDDENRIYSAALDEAAELVWRHQHGKASPPPDAPYRYRPHLRKNSYGLARAASVGDVNAVRQQATRSFSGSSTESEGRPSLDQTQAGEQSSRKTKTYGSVGSRSSQFSEQRRHGSLKRNISGEVERPFSGDQIWEEPESSPRKDNVPSGRASPEKLSSRPQNPTARVRFEPVEEEESVKGKRLDKVEIHRNPPTRSRNAQYTTNSVSEAPPVDDKVERKNGIEVRSDDIRAATSMRLKDRSPNLPEPTAVSDSPGRPIVSFDASWKAPDESTDITPDRSTPAASSSPFKPKAKPMEIPSIVVAEESTPMSSSANTPSISVAGPDDEPRGSIPSINVPTINVPTISVDETPGDHSIPSIVTPDDKPAARARPLPTPKATGPPRRAQRPRGHWSPAPGNTGRVNTICHECDYPIEGRFVALAGGCERFHPHCFSCYSCGTGLEAMEISPEPNKMRHERLERIRRRAAGEILDEIPGMTMAEDGDERLRFFCHLDWHELFAPRCKHCHTPILGEHIVALGEHWHYGHFFCAECGDPFEHGMTHIEKDGYAWCINCQTKRTERRAPKCKKCKKAVIGQYIQALGGEWHDACFRCAECRGGFDDGQIFPKEVDGMFVILCTGCRAMELKA
ncbi:hypothetical protein EDB81DRAFT_870648 [Dactylonectria macrodidyma]|uniref:LIM zinc-binding domain-containing protein n=1 Tax=Dactylonectria macrodidyma TaxID=307937 RepID=A0A9P9EGD2_9HYPO|nr:hypothetical protein EDB81DRAFT_870648 [Dactylonectria macrodidyma]